VKLGLSYTGKPCVYFLGASTGNPSINDQTPTMREIKILIGILAAMFATGHFLGLIFALSTGHINFGSPFAATEICTRVFCSLIGAAIAVVCLRPNETT
jgi:DMSO/TMAO reductase YedYZ heme-binding membrane subunit